MLEEPLKSFPCNHGCNHLLSEVDCHDAGLCQIAICSRLQLGRKTLHEYGIFIGIR